MNWGSPYPQMDIDDSGDLMIVGHNADIFLYQRSASTFTQLYTYTWSTDVKSIAIAGDGSKAFIGGNSGEIMIINLTTYTILQTLPSPSLGSVRLLNTNSDGTYIAVGYNGGSFCMYSGSTSYSMLGSALSGYSTPKNELKTSKDFTIICMNTVSAKIHIFQRNTTDVWDLMQLDDIDDYAVDEEFSYFAGEVTSDVRTWTITNYTFTSYNNFTNPESLSNFICDPSGRFLLVGGSSTTSLYINCGD